MARRSARRLAIGLVSGGAVVGAVLIGALIAGPSTDEAVPPPTSRRSPPSTAAPAASIPDLGGYTAYDATAAMLGLGIEGEAIEIDETPRAGDSGLVVGQDRPPGGEPGPLLLEVSDGIEMPDYTGRQLDAAQAQLEGWGAEVRTVQRFEPRAVVGAVIEQVPRPGEMVTTVVELTIAGEPDSILLTEVDMRGIEGPTCSTDVIEAGGGAGTPSIACSVDVDEPARALWVTSPDLDLLDLSLGVESSDPLTDAVVRLAVLGDGEVLSVREIRGARSERITIPVRGLSRIELRAVLVREPTVCCASTVAVFGGPTLRGTVDTIGQYRLVMGLEDP